MPKFEKDNPQDLCRLIIKNINASISIVFENMPELEEENSQDLYRLPAKETCLISVSPHSLIDIECTSIAPGEGRQLKSILNGKFCEELSFPHPFPTGKSGRKVQTEKTLSPVKYFNQRLLNYTQKFASDTDYIFFARNVLQNKNMLEQINIARSKVSALTLRAGLLNNPNISDTLNQYFENDQTHAFVNSIKGTPAY